MLSAESTADGGQDIISWANGKRGTEAKTADDDDDDDADGDCDGDDVCFWSVINCMTGGKTCRRFATTAMKQVFSKSRPPAGMKFGNGTNAP